MKVSHILSADSLGTNLAAEKCVLCPQREGCEGVDDYIVRTFSSVGVDIVWVFFFSHAMSLVVDGCAKRLCIFSNSLRVKST